MMPSIMITMCTMIARVRYLNIIENACHISIDVSNVFVIRVKFHDVMPGMRMCLRSRELPLCPFSSS